MNSKNFFTGRAIVLIVLIIIGLVYFYYKNSTVSVNDETNEPRSFTWKFEKAESLNLDGIPKTNVFLDIEYNDGSIQEKLVDTTDGGCSELPDSDKDSALNSKNIQCYYAGLGYRYKIVKGDESYTVLRKTFEEGSEDYTPTLNEYEKILDIL